MCQLDIPLSCWWLFVCKIKLKVQVNFLEIKAIIVCQELGTQMIHNKKNLIAFFDKINKDVVIKR